jgi:hypothetical protein
MYFTVKCWQGAEIKLEALAEECYPERGTI